MQRAKIILLILSLINLSTLLAAVPIAWTVETSRLQPVAFDALHGETLELAASFQSYGKPLEITGEAALYYQTNGMGSAWWQIPATVQSNRIEAVFTPADDPGASRLICFLGGTASTYRAAFTLRFANSPGFTPNVLPAPESGYTETDPTVPEWAKAPTKPTYTASEVGALPLVEDSYGLKTAVTIGSRNDYRVGSVSLANGNMVTASGRYSHAEGAGTTASGDYSRADGGGSNAAADYSHAGGFMSWTRPGDDYAFAWNGDDTISSTYESNGKGTFNVNPKGGLDGFYIGDKTLPQVISDCAASKDDMNTVWNYMMAENFRVTITNYDSSVHAPEAQYDFRLSTNEPWRVVWTETNGLARTHTAATNDALKAAKAEIAKPENRAWGRYDATTGAPAPEGIVQVSAEGGLMIGGGMGYTSVAASGGEYWVLTSTDPTLCRTGTNGVFEIIDSSGNAAVSVRKGDKRLVPAPAGGISATADEITIVYLIESAEHPEIECSASLTGGGTWYTPGEDGAPFGAATWTGSNGSWSVTIQKSGSNMGFFRASYYTGGGTVVSYGEAAIEMPKIKIGNVEYKVGTATISGHTVLTLTQL